MRSIIFLWFYMIFNSFFVQLFVSAGAIHQLKFIDDDVGAHWSCWGIDQFHWDDGRWGWNYGGQASDSKGLWSMDVSTAGGNPLLQKPFCSHASLPQNGDDLNNSAWTHLPAQEYNE